MIKHTAENLIRDPTSIPASKSTRTRTKFLQEQEQTKAVITTLNSEPRIPKDSAHAEPGY